MAEDPARRRWEEGCRNRDRQETISMARYRCRLDDLERCLPQHEPEASGSR
jgi:hypothetical protein